MKKINIFFKRYYIFLLQKTSVKFGFKVNKFLKNSKIKFNIRRKKFLCQKIKIINNRSWRKYSIFTIPNFRFTTRLSYGRLCTTFYISNSYCIITWRCYWFNSIYFSWCWYRIINSGIILPKITGLPKVHHLFLLVLLLVIYMGTKNLGTVLGASISWCNISNLTWIFWYL